MTDRPDQVSPRSRQVLRATLPIGIVMLIGWVAWLVVEVVLGDVGGLSVVSAVLGLVTSLVLIASGISYRRALRRP